MQNSKNNANYIICKEGDEFSLEDLKTFLNLVQDEQGFIDKLQAFKIIDRTRKQSTDLERLKNSSDNTSDDTATEDDKKYTIKFIGIVTLANRCLIIFPKYIKKTRDELNITDPADKDKLKQLIKVILTYKKRNEQPQDIIDDSSEVEPSKNINLFPIVLKLIEYYKEYGLYHNDRLTVETNGDGEILWERTINEETALLCNNVPIYLNLLTQNQENNKEDYFRRLHAFILSDACKKMSTILDIMDIEPINISGATIEDFGSIEFILIKINQELATQFITYKQEILKNIKKYIIGEYNKSSSQNLFFVGTRNFNKIWEDVCSVFHNNQKDVLLSSLGLNNSKYQDTTLKLKDVISKPTWGCSYTDIESVSEDEESTLKNNNRILPDIVFLNLEEKTLFIYDAKYYDSYINNQHLKGNPNVTDVFKQYMYELAYYDFIAENNLTLAENVFLLPLDEDQQQELAYAEFKPLKSVLSTIRKDTSSAKIGLMQVSCTEYYKEYLLKLGY